MDGGEAPRPARNPLLGRLVNEKSWFVYLVESATGYIYCGCSNDVPRRVHEHNHTKKGARALRGQRPVKLIWYAEVPEGKIVAHKLEWHLKRRVSAWKRKVVANSNPGVETELLGFKCIPQALG